MATITLESVRSFESEQRIAAEAFRQVSRLAALVDELEDCEHPAERAPTHMEGIGEVAADLRDRLLLIAGAMTDDDGRTAFEVGSVDGGSEAGKGAA